MHVFGLNMRGMYGQPSYLAGGVAYYMPHKIAHITSMFTGIRSGAGFVADLEWRHRRETIAQYLQLRKNGLLKPRAQLQLALRHPYLGELYNLKKMFDVQKNNVLARGKRCISGRTQTVNDAIRFPYVM